MSDYDRPNSSEKSLIANRSLLRSSSMLLYFGRCRLLKLNEIKNKMDERTRANVGGQSASATRTDVNVNCTLYIASI